METSEFASRLNKYVYDAVITWRRTDADGAQTPVVFRCECGCNRPVWRTIEEYDAAGGARHASHRPSEPRRLIEGTRGIL